MRRGFASIPRKLRNEGVAPAAAGRQVDPAARDVVAHLFRVVPPLLADDAHRARRELLAAYFERVESSRRNGDGRRRQNAAAPQLSAPPTSVGSLFHLNSDVSQNAKAHGFAWLQRPKRARFGRRLARAVTLDRLPMKQRDDEVAVAHVLGVPRTQTRSTHRRTWRRAARRGHCRR